MALIATTAIVFISGHIRVSLHILTILKIKYSDWVLGGAKPNTNCEDLYVSGERNSGVYRIRPFGNEIQVDVYCNMATEGGGWTAIQRRMSGSVGFNRTWAEYKNGFGNPHDSYWIGNDVMHHLTKGRNSSLYVSLTLKHGTTLYEVYHQFSISEEAEKYRLFLGGPANGTLGDMLLNTGDSSSVLSGMYFSTLDRDYDSSGVYNCAAYFGGGWWFNACHYACLNGPWNTSAWVNPWFPKVPSGIHVTETIMMIKPH
ncbi:fibroleukin-like [Saccostrea cucullata]|uniref:fibroleukin-like n=1 Tax=Saccostrea cuccullata TaxID=36930 RepID=UPI002ED3D583